MKSMNDYRKTWSSHSAARILAVAMTLMMAVTMMPWSSMPKVYGHTARGTLETVTPELAVTGTKVIGGDAYTADNISWERAYTRDEMKKMEGAENDIAYSSINTSSTKKFYKASGVPLKSLLAGTAFDAAADKLTIIASDGYKSSFDPGAEYQQGNRNTTGLNEPRYYYPNFMTDSSEGAKEVPTILAWAYDENASKVPDAAAEQENMRIITGQLKVDDQNNPAFNGGKFPVRQLIGGEALSDAVLTVGSKSYTRADVLLMDRAEKEYSYDSKGGSVTDYVRGVPLAVLLKDCNDTDTVTFDTADNYNVAANGMTVKDLVENDYMIAYEKGTSSSDLSGIFTTSKIDLSAEGYFTLYGNNASPGKMINKITVTTSSGIDFSNSPFKHITNGGKGGDAPYNIDAITGATMTVEGPGVKKSVPLPVRNLESENAGLFRGEYTDFRGDGETARTYEGLDLYYLLHNMQTGDKGIVLTDKAAKVVLKDRNRKNIASLTLDEIKKMHDAGTPALIAYGTSDGTNTAPFVFDRASGIIEGLGNEDGCLKLVYDLSKTEANPNYKTFSNMAYIYVAEDETPGYKHNTVPYDTAENSQYVLTVTGSEIGREVNYKVEDLENMVEYDADNKPAANGMGYRDEYSLANSNYWYVNEYEGVQLWKLLQKSGLPESKKTDDKTKVTFTARDGYKDFDSFSLNQIADPECFKFYEKSAEDKNDGTYEEKETDIVKKGYPVLVAYGVNRYPYVINKKLDGYLSGLENDGGPLRVISGKTDYHHANGSKQAKLLDKVVAGEDKYHYSTHKYHEDKVYTDLADSAKIKVTVRNGADADAPVYSEKEYTAGEIEELIYGGKLTSSELADAKVKEFYEVEKGSKSYSDLYEGIDLAYFLKEIVNLPGAKGSITFGDSQAMNLQDVLTWKDGYNSVTKINDLKPVLAYAKNGAPLVGSTDAAGGYQGTVTVAAGTEYENKITVKNNGGPLQVLFPGKSAGEGEAPQSMENVTSITVNLSTDNYAHTKAPYDAYKDKTVKISGEGSRITGEKTFTVSELEGKQTLSKTGDYSVKKGETVTQQRYRGTSLYDLLRSTAVGLKPNADKVIVTASDGRSASFTISQVRKADYLNSVTGKNDLSMILAYGAASADNPDPEDGKPLVEKDTSEGYDAEYQNSGGPIKLVVGQTDENDSNSGSIVKDVASIEVTASADSSWNHSSSEVFKQYLKETVNLTVADQNEKELFNKDYTVEQLEAMTQFVEREEINTPGINTWEGINFWNFINQEAGNISGIEDPMNIVVTAQDGFFKDLRSIFSMDEITNGIKDGEQRVPILLGYAVDGYPLASGGKSETPGEGYEPTIKNNGGPIRLLTHNNQGACLQETVKIRITVGKGGTDPQPAEKDFNLYGLDGGTVSYDIKGLKNAGAASGVVKDHYTSKKGTDYVRGIYLSELLETKGITGTNAAVDVITTDGFTAEDYENIKLKDLEDQKYLIAYDTSSNEGTSWDGIKDTSKDGKTTATIRIYRNYDDGSGRYNRMDCVKGVTVKVKAPEFEMTPADGKEGNLPNAGIRATWMDKDGGLWVGTYGGGAAYKAKGEKTYKIYDTGSNPALESGYASAVAADKDGGVWITQNASYTEPDKNKGIAYMKDGKVTYYRASDNPATIPNDYVQEVQVADDGIVWFGSFGGLTKYDPKAKTWTTIDRKDGFPAMSIDNLILDGQGGAWCGFYPDGKGTKDDPFKGGFAHIDKEGKITPYEFTADYNEAAQTSKLADVWVRDIAVDSRGGAWIVASGSQAGMENAGGRVWYVKSPGAEPEEYTGDQLFGNALDGGDTAEVRMVAADPDGGLWFGTSADGIFYVKDPAVSKDKTMSITAQYSKASGAWSADNMDNIYSLDIYGDSVYAGSSGGLAVLKYEFTGKDVLDEFKETAVSQLKDYVKLSDYRAAQQAQVKAAIADGEKNIMAAKDKADVTQALNAAKAAIDKIETASQLAAAELAAAKEMANSELLTYKSMTIYRPAERQMLISLVMQGQRAIAAADSISDVNTILTETKASINQLKTAAQWLAEEQQAAMRKTLTKTVKLSAASASYKSVKLKWTKVSGASGYVIYQSTKKNSGFKKIKTIGSAAAGTYTKGKLKTGKTYYYKVRAYGKAGGKTLYGKYSSVKAAKPIPKTPVMKAAASGKRAVIKWRKVSGASGYTIYRANKKAGKYVKAGTLAGGSKVKYTNSGLKKGKTYYYKMKAYRTVNGKKVYSKYSAVRKVQVK